MLVSYDWRVRHAGLMAIAAIGEGTGKVRTRTTTCGAAQVLTFSPPTQVMLNELGKVVE